MNTIEILSVIYAFVCIIFGLVLHFDKYKYLLTIEQRKKIEKEKLTKISRNYKWLFFCIGFLLLTGLFTFHYLDIYQHINKLFSIAMLIGTSTVFMFGFRIMCELGKNTETTHKHPHTT